MSIRPMHVAGLVLLLTTGAMAQSTTATDAAEWFSLGNAFALDDGATTDPSLIEARGSALAETGTKPPPLPLHNIEGHGGGPMTPTAYMVHPSYPGQDFTLPAVSYTHIATFGGNKHIHTLGVSWTLWGRVELAYAFSNFHLGSTADELRKRGIPLTEDSVNMHTWSARLMLIEENSFDCMFIPAVTAGVHVKYTPDLPLINRQAGGALNAAGYRRENGIDFTLTASKTLPPDLLGVPIILSAGLRNSEASNLGYLGFGGDGCEWTFEGNAIAILTNWFALGYEFRGKADPYAEVPGLLLGEDNFHAIFFAFILSDRLTVAGGWAYFGDMANTPDTSGMAFQVKYEF